MSKTFEYKFEVRGYELDSFGHVNNAVYLNYLEQARWDIVKEIGLFDFIKTTDWFLIVVESNVRYINELTIFDKAFIETSMVREGFFVTFKQDIYKDEKTRVAKCRVKCLFVDQQRQPMDIPDIVYPFLS